LGNTRSNPNTGANYTNGTLIASGHVVNNVSNFTANPDGTVGIGSYNLAFAFDYVNNAYLDIVTNNITGFTLTGTTNTPPQYKPANFWDGTATAGLTNVTLKVDSSLSFTAASVAALPEPSSLALVGVALGGLGLSASMRRRNMKH
jgi:lysozyme family protein